MNGWMDVLLRCNQLQEGKGSTLPKSWTPSKVGLGKASCHPRLGLILVWSHRHDQDVNTCTLRRQPSCILTPSMSYDGSVKAWHVVSLCHCSGRLPFEGSGANTLPTCYPFLNTRPYVINETPSTRKLNHRYDFSSTNASVLLLKGYMSQYCASLSPCHF